MEGFEDLLRACEAWNFGPPPVPPSLRPLIRAQSRACWGTREVSPQDRYDLIPTLARVLYERTEDYLSLSHIGHGVNSYFISYQLVHGPLLLFLQTAWGGVYMDNDVQAGIVAERFRAAGALLAAVEQARPDAWQGRGRLVVAEFGEDWHSHGVAEWLRQQPKDRSAAKTWITDRYREEPPAAALRRALAMVEGGPGPHP